MTELLTDRFLARLRQTQTPLYELARQARVNRFWLSRLLSADAAVRAHDERIVRLGTLLGLMQEEVFTEAAFVSVAGVDDAR